MYDVVYPQGLNPGTYTMKSTVTDFQKAFFAAWKANQEYALNGLLPQPDGVVLLHLIRLWNAAHKPGQVILVQQKDMPSFSYTGPCQNQGFPKYFETIVNQVPISQSDPYYSAPIHGSAPDGSAAIFIYSGNQHSVPSLGSTPPSVLTQRAVAAGSAAAAVAALGVVAYSQVSGVALGTVAKGIWDAVKAPVAKLIRRA